MCPWVRGRFRLANYALKAGISIAIENTRRVKFISTLLEAIDNKNLGLCYDTSHGRLYEENTFDLLKRFPHRLKCLHISDNDGLEDRHWNIHEGIIDWNAFTQKFPVNGECQALSLEVYPKFTNQSEEDFLKQVYACASELRELIQNRTS